MTEPLTGTEEGLRRLERELDRARQNGARLGRSVHQAMLVDLRAALKRADAAEKEAREAHRRADRAEATLKAKLTTIHASTTWKAGRALTAVPRAAKRAVRRGSK
jgi:hypothetical protein